MKNESSLKKNTHADFLLASFIFLSLTTEDTDSPVNLRNTPKVIATEYMFPQISCSKHAYYIKNLHESTARNTVKRGVHCLVLKHWVSAEEHSYYLVGQALHIMLKMPR